MLPPKTCAPRLRGWITVPQSVTPTYADVLLQLDDTRLFVQLDERKARDPGIDVAFAAEVVAGDAHETRTREHLGRGHGLGVDVVRQHVAVVLSAHGDRAFCDRPDRHRPTRPAHAPVVDAVGTRRTSHGGRGDRLDLAQGVLRGCSVGPGVGRRRLAPRLHRRARIASARVTPDDDHVFPVEAEELGSGAGRVGDRVRTEVPDPLVDIEPAVGPDDHHTVPAARARRVGREPDPDPGDLRAVALPREL
jgi:hypothetical protein